MLRPALVQTPEDGQGRQTRTQGRRRYGKHVLGETMPENTLLGTQRGGRTEKMDEYETYVPRDQLAPPLRSGFQARKKRFTSNVLYPVTGDILLRMTYHRCCVTLQVLKARNLKAPNKPGYSNPYCKIHVVPPGRAENTYNYRTRYISQNVSPEWKETFTFQGIDPDEINHKKIAISVWHYNPMWVDIFLGEVVVDLKDPINLDETRRWYQLN
ncbi:protein piccolo-like [Paramacrobiotus metropolitanus]|uniref:protein piccolo-like n=1 Tax=Paramacrobiotus metropolitanus TaxID=2943436 RepID=UPI0024464296|nr:protein piccolo-like [Paramacrobiotus metropolitanus]